MMWFMLVTKCAMLNAVQNHGENHPRQAEDKSKRGRHSGIERVRDTDFLKFYHKSVAFFFDLSSPFTPVIREGEEIIAADIKTEIVNHP